MQTQIPDRFAAQTATVVPRGWTNFPAALALGIVLLVTALLLMLLSADGGTALSLADVKLGDLVEYDIDSQATLTLRACAKNETTLTIAVSLTTKEKKAYSSLLDGVLVEQPFAPLVPAPPELKKPTSLSTWRAAGGVWETCGFWKRPFSMHGKNGDTRRCEGQELILGGGMVHSTDSVFTIRGGGYNHEVALKRFGQLATPCPKWPRARVAGWYRMLETGGWVSDGNPGTSNLRTFAAGGSWVRMTEGTSEPKDFYLVDLLVGLSRRRVSALKEASPSEMRVGPQKIETWDERTTYDGGYFYDTVTTRWARPGTLPDAPLELRASPVSWEKQQESAGEAKYGFDRLTAWGSTFDGGVPPR